MTFKILHFISTVMIFVCIFVSVNGQKSWVDSLTQQSVSFLSPLISGVTAKFPEIFYLDKQYQSKLEAECEIKSRENGWMRVYATTILYKILSTPFIPKTDVNDCIQQLSIDSQAGRDCKRATYIYRVCFPKCALANIE